MNGNETKSEQMSFECPFINLPLLRISDLIIIAREGGSNYWATNYKIKTRGKNMDPSFRNCIHMIPFFPGGSISIDEIIENRGGDSELVTHVLDYNSILRGMKIMVEDFARHWADFLNENDDATTADVFLQCCLFGEVIYG